MGVDGAWNCVLGELANSGGHRRVVVVVGARIGSRVSLSRGPSCACDLTGRAH